MSTISSRCRYALWAIFELARQRETGAAVPVAEIAARHSIPPRFLEQILGQLRQAGYVETRRGITGGSVLVADPAKLTVGDIIRTIEGPIEPIRGLDSGDASSEPVEIFTPIWREARDALSAVYDRWTFQDLLEVYAERNPQVSDYSI